MAKKLSGGGITSNKLVRPGVRTGSPSKGSSPGAADQIGQTVAFKKEQVGAGRGYDGAKYGNELATNVGKGGPGTGRTTYKCGTQGLHGSVNPGIPESKSTTFETFFPGIKDKPMGSGK